MKRILFAVALLTSQKAFAEPEHLNYEKLIDCVEMSLSLDTLLKDIQTTEGLSSKPVADPAANGDAIREEFNSTAVRFNEQCSYTTYDQDELAMICTNQPYDESMFCKTMAW